MKKNDGGTRMKKRYVLAEGYPDFCHSDVAICMHKNEWRTEHLAMNPKGIYGDLKYRLILERIK